MSLLRVSVSALAVVTSAGASVHATPRPEPSVIFRASGFNASSARIAGDRVAFFSGFEDLRVWDLIRPPQSIVAPAVSRTLLALSETAVAWHQSDLNDGHLMLVVKELGGSGGEVDVAAGLRVDYSDFSLDGRCIAFATFGEDFTKSVYRACVAGGVLVSRTDIDGNLVRENGNPIGSHSNVRAFDGDVLWTASAFDPFVAAPLLYDSGAHTLKRLVFSQDKDHFTAALNADTALLWRPTGISNSTTFVRYNRGNGALQDINPIGPSGFWGGWIRMNEDSDVSFDYDFGDGNGQRVRISRPGQPLRSLTSNTADHALGDGVVVYTFGGRVRLKNLDTGYDTELSSTVVYPGSPEASGRRVLWLEGNDAVAVALPAREAIDATIAAVRTTSMPLLVRVPLLAALVVARVAVPIDLKVARAALATFEGLLAFATSHGQVTSANAGPLANASATIRAALDVGEQGLCGNNVDDDRDGRKDCADSDCAGDALCREAFACADGRDNDRNGLIDCNDGDCAGQAECTETSAECSNGSDDDHDGDVDCDDSDCANQFECQEHACDDGLDNDGNGAVDCDDANCTYDPACYEYACGDGSDNDDDGAVDCDDDDCAFDTACYEFNCSNGGDDDNDGAVDCDDSDCASNWACGEQGTLQCEDAVDNDADALVDCDDLECGLSLACTSPTVDLGSATGTNVASGDLVDESDESDAPCGLSGGPEAELGWTAPAAGTYVFGTFGSEIDTLLTVSSDMTLGCNDDANNLFQSQVSLTLGAGEHVLIVVHAYSGVFGPSPFVLSITGP